MRYYKAFAVTGSANELETDSGLESTQAEPKTVQAVLVSVSDYKGNKIEGWIERERVLEIYDYVVNTHANTGGTNTVYSTTKMVRIPIEAEIPVGQSFKIGIRCGSNATNLYGAYEYTITGRR